MKIAISAAGDSLVSEVAEVFGRCPYFLIAEIENGKIIKTEALKNESESRQSGAGIAAAQLMADRKIETVIAKNVGPKAADILKQFNIEVYNASGSIQGVLDNFAAKK